MSPSIYDYREAGFTVFGLHGATHGACDCGHTDCKALYKHPVMHGWEKTPFYDDEQLEAFDSIGHFESGFGVLCKGWLVIDVDARNGGVESFKRLCADYPIAASSAFVVATGSGGGSEHHYFKLPTEWHDKHLASKMDAYQGIDFKTSGFVVGAGSLHVSGREYEAIKGYPQDTAVMDGDFLAVLQKRPFLEAVVSGQGFDGDMQKLADMLAYIDPSCEYHAWLEVGMAIHHLTSGGQDGFTLWDTWSAKSPKYTGAKGMMAKWQGFGKTVTPVGFGTLYSMAVDGGYMPSVTFDSVDFEQQDTVDNPVDNPVDSVSILDEPVDLKSPPGFVGELTRWFNDQCLYPRESLAVAAALVAVSSIAGMRVQDALDNITPNILAFCIAGSGTGKESILQAYMDVLRYAGVQAALHGGIKSDQEVTRNLLRHQAAFYCVDEFGDSLAKIKNASKKGGASYLESVLATIMSVYSKASGYLPITGDLKEQIKADLAMEYAKIAKKLEELPQGEASDALRGRLTREQEYLQSALVSVDDGIKHPYLTFMGISTPVDFYALIDFKMATNGFMARSVLFNELETNPRAKRRFKKREIPEYMKAFLRGLYTGQGAGCFDMHAESRSGRVCMQVDEKVSIETEEAAIELLEQVYQRFYELAEHHKSDSGLEAIPRRGYEIASKISLILAIATGVRTVGHVRYGFAMAWRDVQEKIKLALGNERANQIDGVMAKILALVSKDHGETRGVICNRLRPLKKEDVEKVLKKMVDDHLIRAEETAPKKGGHPTILYFAC